MSNLSISDLCQKILDILNKMSLEELGIQRNRTTVEELHFNFLEILNHDRKNNQMFCNFTIMTETRQFMVHKCLVGVASDFFKMSMTTEMKEKYQNSISVQCVADNIMENIIDYIYGCRLKISVNNCCELYSASDFLQIPQLTESCRKYICKIIPNNKNVVSFWKFAYRYSLDELLHRCEDFLINNFASLIESGEIFKAPFELFEIFLTFRDAETSEECFCELIMNWVEFNDYERRSQFPLLFKLVNLSKLDKLFVTLKLLENATILDNPESLRQLMTLFKFYMESSFTAQPNSNEIQKVSNKLILVRKTDEDKETLVEQFNVTTKKLIKIFQENVECLTAFMSERNRLYIVGLNQNWKSVSEIALYSLDIKNKTDKSWTVSNIPMIAPSLRWFACTLFNNSLYLVGGKTSSPDSYENSVQCFSFETQKWTKSSCMNEKRSGCCVVVHEKLMYVLGGEDASDTRHLSSMEIYNGNVWEIGAAMLRGRTQFAAVVFNNKLYAIGGFGKHCYNRYCTFFREVEAYDFVKKTWSNVSSLYIPRAHHGACVSEEKIYVIGGNNSSCFSTIPVECYNSEKWTTLDVTTEISSLSVFALRLDNQSDDEVDEVNQSDDEVDEVNQSDDKVDEVNQSDDEVDEVNQSDNEVDEVNQSDDKVDEVNQSDNELDGVKESDDEGDEVDETDSAEE